MKDLNSYIERINEDFFDTVGASGRLYNDYMVTNGFQFGWSAHISNADWFPIFDMNYLRNYYQKYFNDAEYNRNIDSVVGGEHFYVMKKKHPRNSKYDEWWDLNQAALCFAIMSIKTAEPNQKDIENQLKRFLNKENGADKDTKIKVCSDVRKKTWYGEHYEVPVWTVYIWNSRIFPAGNQRPLFIEISKKLFKENK